MSIFISYSHDDEGMVERIAESLVENNVYVWIDRWELNYGDSLISKIQMALTECSAVLIMLSKASLESEWCKKELSVGLIRELDEKQVLLIPILLEDCNIPLFLKDKYYADFRGDYNEAIRKLQNNLIKITDLSMRRVRKDKYFIDWALDDGLLNDKLLLHIDTVSFQKELDYSILCTLDLYANVHDSLLYITASNQIEIINEVIKNIFTKLRNDKKLNILLPDSTPRSLKIELTGGYIVDIYIRRLGNNNPFDILFDYGSILSCIEDVRSIKKI